MQRDRTPSAPIRKARRPSNLWPAVTIIVMTMLTVLCLALVVS